jgi:hypothetical protein
MSGLNIDRSHTGRRQTEVRRATLKRAPRAVAGALCCLAFMSTGACTAEVASQTFRISTAHGSASEPVDLSLDWSQPQPQD